MLLHNNDTVVMEIGPRFGKSVSLPVCTNHVVLYLVSGDTMQLLVPARQESTDDGDQSGSFNKFTSPSDVTLTAFFVA